MLDVKACVFQRAQPVGIALGGADERHHPQLAQVGRLLQRQAAARQGKQDVVVDHRRVAVLAARRLHVLADVHHDRIGLAADKRDGDAPHRHEDRLQHVAAVGQRLAHEVDFDAGTAAH